MIDIYYIHNGQKMLRLSVDVESATYHKEIMAEEYVELKFNTDTPVLLKNGDFIETEYGKFEIYRLTPPSHDFGGSGSWTYDQKFHATWGKWANHILFYDRQKGNELSWHLTSTPANFLKIVCSNLMALGYGEYVGVVEGDTFEKSDEAKLITFDKADIISALNQIAQTWETEWYVTDNIIHIGKLQYGDSLELHEGDIIDGISQSQGSGEYITRLYAFGSTRNLPTNYRKDETSEGVIEAVVETRLKLPADTPYIDAWENIVPEDVVEGVAVFEDIYPKLNRLVSDVDTVEYVDEKTDTDGNVIYERWNAFRFRDKPEKPEDGVFHFSQQYILPTEQLRVVFLSGALNGMDFDVIFNPMGALEKINGQWNENAQVFEIVRNENYGIKIPNEIMRPREDDKYVLYGWDTRKIGDMGLVESAEQTLKREAVKKLGKLSVDPNVYTCKANIVRCSGYVENNGVLVYDSEARIDLDIGQAVTLFHDEYFARTGGRRESRIRGFNKNLFDKYDCEYIIGESTEYSRIKETENKIQALATQSQVAVTGGGTSVYLIKSIDSSIPTDFNAYSAKRSRIEFLNRLADDTAKGRIAFDNGLDADRDARLKGGASFGTYAAGFMGGNIDSGGNAEFESVTSRSFLKVFELIFNRINALEGNTSFADSGTIEDIADLGDGNFSFAMRKRWDGDFTAFQPGDVIYGYVNNLHDGAASEYYKAWGWVRSVDRDANSIVVALYPDSECPGGVNHPFAPSMVISRWGNNVEPTEYTHANTLYQSFILPKGDRLYYNTRQQSFYISCEDGNIVELMGVNKPILERSNYGALLGRIPDGLLDPSVAKNIHKGQPYLYARGIVVQDLLRLDYEGNTLRTPNYRGQWSAETAVSEHPYMSESSYYDMVTHNGLLWQCLASNNIDEPTDHTGSWLMMTESDDMAQWHIYPDADVITVRADSVTPSILGCTVQRIDRSGESVFTDTFSLNRQGVRLWWSADGVAWSLFTMGIAQPIETEDGQPIETEDGGALGTEITIGGDNIDTAMLADRVVFELRTDNEAQMVLARASVPVVRDGKKGDRGDDGKDGLMAYPAGVFDPATIYTSSGKTTPVVQYGNDYYVLKPNRIYRGTTADPGRETPADDAVLGGDACCWELVDKFKAIYTDILMADFGKISSAVFFGDWMISQYGTLTDKETVRTPYFSDGEGKTYAVNAGTVLSTSQRYKWSSSNEDMNADNPDVPTDTSIPEKPEGREYLWAYPLFDNGGEITFSPVCLNPDREEITSVIWQYAATTSQWTEPYESEWTIRPMTDDAKPWLHVRTLVKTASIVVTTNSTRYEKFKVGLFEPNFAVNMLTGQMNAMMGRFSGEVNAKTGTIGNLRIKDNSLCGFDDEGNERVRIGIGELPSVEDVFVRKYINGYTVSTTTAGAVAVGKEIRYTVEYTSGDVPDMEADALFDWEITETPKSLTVEGIHVDVQKYKGIDEVTIQSMNATLYHKTGATDEFAVIDLSNYDYLRDNDIWTIEVNDKGFYRLEITVRAAAENNTSWDGEIAIGIGGMLVTLTQSDDSESNCTTLASDGLLCMQGRNKYMMFSEDRGFEVRIGAYGFRVGADGVKKLNTHQDNNWQPL